MLSRLSTFLTAVAFAMILTGCASHPPKVSCEGALHPINPPAPAVHSEVTGHEG
jgi:hypothetical protein